MIKILIIGGNIHEAHETQLLIQKKMDEVEVLPVAGEEDGLAGVREFNPDVILIDFLLPKTKGYLVCKYLKENKETKHIPIVLMTFGHTGTGDRISGLQAGCDAFIAKPIDAGELAVMIKVMYRIKKAESELRIKNKELEEEVKNKTEELIINELRYISLFETAGNIIVVADKYNRFIQWNNSAERFYHIKKEEAVGKTIQELVLDAKMREFILRVFERIKEGKRVENYVLKFKDGDELKTVLWNITKLSKPDGTYNGFLGIGQDITLREKALYELKKKEEQLRQSEQFFKRIMDAANDAIILLDNDYNIKLWNKAAIKIFGFTRKEAIDQNIFEKIFPYSYKSLIEKYCRQIFEQNNDTAIGFTFGLSAKQKKGKTLPIEISMSGTKFRNRSYLIVIAKDITERKRTEKELLRAKEKAEESDNLKTAFLSNMSHEIRTPMNAIVGFSQLLSNPNFDQKKKDIFVEQISINSESLLKLIEDIIYISKIEAGKIEIIKTDCSLNKLMNELHTSFLEHKRRMGKDNVELKLYLDVLDEELVINTDSQRLKQIFTNLLSNALKFTEKGFVEFGYRLQEEGFILFYVKDTGMGINKEKLRYVFDRFTKVSANKTKLYGGTGLGLSITKHLVEYLGGEIWVESEENTGSTFKFTHPLEKQQVNLRYEEHLSVPDISELLKDVSVLVAEDEEINFLFLKETLTQAGADVDWAKNGQEAIELAKESDYDLVLMDMKMPVIDGYDATKIIKKYNPDIPIIAQTAYALPDEQQLGYEAGCDDYLSKPIDPIRLISLIQRMLNR